MDTVTDQAATPIDRIRAFYKMCGLAQAIRLRRSLGVNLVELRGAVAEAAEMAALERRLLGDAEEMWADTDHHDDDERVAALRATLAAIRAEVADALAALLTFALSSAAAIHAVSSNACTRARRACEALLTKLHGLHHVALLTARHAREVLAVG